MSLTVDKLVQLFGYHVADYAEAIAYVVNSFPVLPDVSVEVTSSEAVLQMRWPDSCVCDDPVAFDTQTLELQRRLHSKLQKQFYSCCLDFREREVKYVFRRDAHVCRNDLPFSERDSATVDVLLQPYRNITGVDYTGIDPERVYHLLKHYLIHHPQVGGFSLYLSDFDRAHTPKHPGTNTTSGDTSEGPVEDNLPHKANSGENSESSEVVVSIHGIDNATTRFWDVLRQDKFIAATRMRSIRGEVHVHLLKLHKTNKRKFSLLGM